MGKGHIFSIKAFSVDLNNHFSNFIIVNNLWFGFRLWIIIIVVEPLRGNKLNDVIMIDFTMSMDKILS